MSLLERLKTLSQEIREPPTPTEVVRVLIFQPISLDELAVKLNEPCVNPEEIELSKHYFVIKGPQAENPWNVMTVGGHIAPETEKMAQKLVEQGEISAYQKKLATIQLEACRQVLDEVHLQGVKHEDVIRLTDDGPRDYSFIHSKRGLVTNREHWVLIRAPTDFVPIAFYERTDKFFEVAALPPNQVKKMFNHNRLRWRGLNFPLVENLKSTGKNTPSSIKKIRETITNTVQDQEIALKLQLAMELADNFPDLETVTEAKLTKELLSTAKSNPEKFNSAYKNFLYSLIRERQSTQESQNKLNQEEINFLKREMLAAWHRVLFKLDVQQSTINDIQGTFTAAKLPLEEICKDEYDFLAEQGPRYVKQFTQFLDKALTPEFNLPGQETEPQLPKTMQDRYKRLEYLLFLKIKSTTHPDDEEAVLKYNYWREHLYKCWLDIFGMTKDDFSDASIAYNEFFMDARKNVAPKAAQSERIYAQMARSPDSSICQLEELLFMAFGYSQYFDPRNHPRNSVLTPQEVFDARMKLLALPLFSSYIRFHREHVLESTYYWRIMWHGLKTGQIEDLATDNFSFPAETDEENIQADRERFAQALAEEYLIDDNMNTREEIEQLPEDNKFTLYLEKANGRKKVKIVPEAEAETAGLDVVRRRLPLEYKGVPIAIFEILILSKTLLSLIRKGIERGYEPEQIKDMFRFACAVDTETEEVQWQLRKMYDQYLKSNKNNAQNFDDFKANWAIEALEKVLLPKIAEVSRQCGFEYSQDGLKNKLRDAQPTGGSAASKGGYHEIKFYAILNTTQSLGEIEQDKKPVMIEATFYREVLDMALKFCDDPAYGLRRWGMVSPGSGLRSLWSLFNPLQIYSSAYRDVAGSIAREEEYRRLIKKRALRDFLNRIFGPLKVGIFNRRNHSSLA